MEHILAFLGGQGSLYASLVALLIAVTLDYITGLAKAWVAHDLQSRRAKEGIIRKMALFAVVAVGGLIDMILPIESHFAICKAFAVAFVCSEGISIVENASACGVSVPESVQKRLSQVAEAVQKEDDDA